MEFLCDIDWLTIVLTDGGEITDLDEVIPLYRWLRCSPLFGYKFGWVDTLTGMKKFKSPERPDMGTCYHATAQPLEALAELHGSASYLFGALQAGLHSGYATRCDFKVDIPDKGISIYELAKQLDAGKVRGTFRKPTIYRGANGTPGCSVNLGSGKSEKYVQAYDKMTESHGIKPYSRIEARLRGRFARQAWEALKAAIDDTERSNVIRSVIRDKVSDFGVDVINETINGIEPFTFSTPIRQDANVTNWLIKQVMPTFLRDAKVHEGATPLLDWFCLEIFKRSNPT